MPDIQNTAIPTTVIRQGGSKLHIIHSTRDTAFAISLTPNQMEALLHDLPQLLAKARAVERLEDLGIRAH